MKNKKVALITGAGRGIGRGIALQLAKNDFDIAGVDIEFDPGNKESGLFEVEAKVIELNADFLAVQGDISSIEDHKEILKSVLDKFDKIDILVNNAGVAPLERLDVLQTTSESYDRVMDINLRGPFFFSQLITSKMLDWNEKIKDYYPKIVFITSISAEVSSINRAEYCISKAGLSMVSKLFADRLSESKVKVFEIRPGIIKTDMTATVKEKYNRLIAEGLIPQKRWGEAEDVAKAVSSLAKGEFDYSTGMIFEVSGGMNIRKL